jgi:hypothetical protein
MSAAARIGLFAALAILLAAAGARAETATLLGKRFDVPAGWSLHPMEGGAALWRADEGAAPASAVVIAPPFAYDGDLGAALDQLADLSQRNEALTINQRGAALAATSDKNAALEIAFLPTLVTDPQAAQTLRTYIAVRALGLVHLFQVTSSSSEADHRTFAMLANFLDDVEYLPPDAGAADADTEPGANCRVVTRQQCMSQMMGAYPNMVPVYNCLPIPQTVCDGE